MDITIEQLQKDTELTLEFIYSVRIVESLSKVNLKTDCDKQEAIKMLERTFLEYKEKLNK
jgi:hypothetical protein